MTFAVYWRELKWRYPLKRDVIKNGVTSHLPISASVIRRRPSRYGYAQSIAQRTSLLNQPIQAARREKHTDSAKLKKRS